MKRNGNRLLVTMPQSALPILRIVVPILILGALAFTLDIDETAKALTAADPILIGAAILYLILLLPLVRLVAVFERRLGRSGRR